MSALRPVDRAGLATWMAVVLLLGAFALMLTSARSKSATCEEDAYIGKGAAAWFRDNYGLRSAHPVLVRLLGTAPLLSEPEFAESVRTLPRCKSGNGRSCGPNLLLFHRDMPRDSLLIPGNLAPSRCWVQFDPQCCSHKGAFAHASER